MAWYQSGTVYIRLPKNYTEFAGQVKPVMGFDLDGTLIWSDRGQEHMRGAEDWVFTSDLVPVFLQQSVKNGWVPVIITNQKFQKGNALPMKMARIDAVIAAAGVDPFVFMATGTDAYRKPGAGTWQLFQQYSGILPRLESFYSGDAVGPNDPNPMYRWADTDLKFAENAWLKFYRPEDLLPAQPQPELSGQQEFIVMVGQPGSGKSTFAQKLKVMHPDKITIISGDEFKSNSGRMLKAAEEALKRGQTVIIDATNPTRAGRSAYLQLAESYNLKPRIFWATRPGKAWNALRAKPVPAIALNMYGSKFERPTVQEGASVERIN
jgi:DNA 3'-phosphatase